MGGAQAVGGTACGEGQPAEGGGDAGHGTGTHDGIDVMEHTGHVREGREGALGLDKAVRGGDVGGPVLGDHAAPHGRGEVESLGTQGKF